MHVTAHRLQTVASDGSRREMAPETTCGHTPHCTGCHSYMCRLLFCFLLLQSDGFFFSLSSTRFLFDPDSLFPDGPRLPQKQLMLGG